MVQKRVLANQVGGWFNTNIHVNAGDKLDIMAINQPSTNPYPWPGGPRFDPDGNRSDGQPRQPWSQAIHPYACFGMLVGRIGIASRFIVGSSYSGGLWATGTLYLAFNDGVNFGDNGGYWDVNIEVSSASGLAALIKSSPLLGCLIKRDYQTHVDDAQAAEAGDDLTSVGDQANFNNGSGYTDPYTRTTANVGSRRVISMTDGIIINVVTENPTTPDPADPTIFDGEQRGITTEVLTWYPFSTVQGHVPSMFYIIQYTHMFPANFTFNFQQAGSVTFPASYNTDNDVLASRLSPDGVFARIQNDDQRTNNVLFGPMVIPGQLIGYYAMIGTASVGPHLHIGLPPFFDNSSASVAIGSDGRPNANQSFLDWLNDRGTPPVDPEPYLPPCHVCPE